MSFIKEVKRVGNHTLKGGYSNLKDVFKFKDTPYFQEFTTYQFEEYLNKYVDLFEAVNQGRLNIDDKIKQYELQFKQLDDVNEIDKLKKEYDSFYSEAIELNNIKFDIATNFASLTLSINKANETLLTAIEDEFDSFSEMISQKEVISEKLRHLPNLKFRKGLYELKINNKVRVEQSGSDLRIKDVDLQNSRIANFGVLYFEDRKDNEFLFLNKIKLISGIEVSESFANYLTNNFEKEGFERNEDISFAGSLGYEGCFEPIEVVKVRKDFLKMFYNHSIGNDIFTMPTEQTIGKYFEIEDGEEEAVLNTVEILDDIDKMFSSKEVRKKVMLAEMCDVSERTIRNWCKDYNINNTAKGVNMREFVRSLKENNYEKYEVFMSNMK